MQALDVKHFHELEVRAIALRIDAFFDEDHISRYGSQIPRAPEVSALAIYESKAIQALVLLCY